MQGVQPGNIGCIVVACDSDEQGNKEHQEGQEKIFYNPFIKNTERGKFLFVVLIHKGSRFEATSGCATCSYHRKIMISKGVKGLPEAGARHTLVTKNPATCRIQTRFTRIVINFFLGGCTNEPGSGSRRPGCFKFFQPSG